MASCLLGSPLEGYSMKGSREAEGRWNPVRSVKCAGKQHIHTNACAPWLCPQLLVEGLVDAGAAAAGDGPILLPPGSLDYTVPEQQRMGSPAPSNEQIQEVLGGASAEAFQWAMAVSTDLGIGLAWAPPVG